MSKVEHITVLEDYIVNYVEPNLATKCILLIREHHERIFKSKGSKTKHQAWDGGFSEHLVETFQIAVPLYDMMNDRRKLPFSISDVIFVLFIHDLEKPFKYVEPIQKITPSMVKGFIMHLLAEFRIELTPEQLNALIYIHGEGEDYNPNERVQLPLAAFVHACDVLSARVWFDYPEIERI